MNKTSLLNISRKVFTKLHFKILTNVVTLLLIFYFGKSIYNKYFAPHPAPPSTALIDSIKQHYQHRIDSLNTICLQLDTQVLELMKRTDSLKNVKQQIQIKYEKDKKNINDADAITHAKWLESILKDTVNCNSKSK